jgi:AcrR family transcriptional regulator
MDSGISINRRIPQQERGGRRVRELLEAGASEFAEVGYDAATMKAIAKRAGASIGAVYQYFPNKESVVSALRNHSEPTPKT